MPGVRHEDVQDRCGRLRGTLVDSEGVGAVRTARADSNPGSGARVALAPLYDAGGGRRRLPCGGE